MTQKERDRLKVLGQVEVGQLNQREAAGQLGVSVRQVRRMLWRVRREGDGGVIHGLRGRAGNRALPAPLRERALGLIEENYKDYGPTLAAETLAECHDVHVHPETLRLWMVAGAGHAQQRRGRGRVRQLRPRRECLGELVQIDTSIHNWLEGRGPSVVLIAMIDDATSRLWARFFAGDTTAANMTLLKDYMERFGRPVAIYSDRASHFVAQPQTPEAARSYRGAKARTQIGRALDELDVRLIAARSPQAKGRVERLFRTLQDRLVKGMRRAGVCSLEEANEYLDRQFIAWWNTHRAQEPASALDAHREVGTHDLAAIFSHQEERTVAPDWTVSVQAKRWQITRSAANAGVGPGARVIVEQRLDGTQRMRSGGRYLNVRPAHAALRELKAAPEGGRELGLRPHSLPPSGSHRHKPSPDHPWKTGHF